MSLSARRVGMAQSVKWDGKHRETSNGFTGVPNDSREARSEFQMNHLIDSQNIKAFSRIFNENEPVQSRIKRPELLALSSKAPWEYRASE